MPCFVLSLRMAPYRVNTLAMVDVCIIQEVCPLNVSLLVRGGEYYHLFDL